MGVAKDMLAEELARLAASILWDMKPHIEEFLLENVAPAVLGGIGAIGGFFDALAETARGPAMSPAIASALPPKLPESEISKQFSLPSMTQAVRDASNAYHHDKGSAAKQRAFAQSMVFAARFVGEAKELFVKNPEALGISLKDYADLFDLATEVSRFRNVGNLNELLREHWELFDGPLRQDLERAVGSKLNPGSPVGPVEAVQFRIDLYAMPQGRE